MRSRVHRSSTALQSDDCRLAAQSDSKFFNLTFLIGCSNLEGSAMQVSMNSLCLILPTCGTDKRLSSTALLAALPVWMLKRTSLVWYVVERITGLFDLMNDPIQVTCVSLDPTRTSVSNNWVGASKSNHSLDALAAIEMSARYESPQWSRCQDFTFGQHVWTTWLRNYLSNGFEKAHLYVKRPEHDQHIIIQRGFCRLDFHRRFSDIQVVGHNAILLLAFTGASLGNATSILVGGCFKLGM